MKIGIIKERKNPPDRRVVLTPKECKRLLRKYENLSIKVERQLIVFKLEIELYPTSSCSM